MSFWKEDYQSSCCCSDDRSFWNDTTINEAVQSSEAWTSVKIYWKTEIIFEIFNISYSWEEEKIMFRVWMVVTLFINILRNCQIMHTPPLATTELRTSIKVMMVEFITRGERQTSWLRDRLPPRGFYDVVFMEIPFLSFPPSI